MPKCLGAEVSREPKGFVIFGGRVAGWPGYNGAKISHIPEKLNPLSRVHARHRRQTRQTTDGFAMPLAKRNVTIREN